MYSKHKKIDFDQQPDQTILIVPRKFIKYKEKYFNRKNHLSLWHCTIKIVQFNYYKESLRFAIV